MLAGAPRRHVQSRASGSCLEVSSSPGSGPGKREHGLVLVSPTPGLPRAEVPEQRSLVLRRGPFPACRDFVKTIPRVYKALGSEPAVKKS